MMEYWSLSDAQQAAKMLVTETLTGKQKRLGNINATKEVNRIESRRGDVFQSRASGVTKIWWLRMHPTQLKSCTITDEIKETRQYFQCSENLT